MRLPPPSSERAAGRYVAHSAYFRHKWFNLLRRATWRAVKMRQTLLVASRWRSLSEWLTRDLARGRSDTNCVLSRDDAIRRSRDQERVSPVWGVPGKYIDFKARSYRSAHAFLHIAGKAAPIHFTGIPYTQEMRKRSLRPGSLRHGAAVWRIAKKTQQLLGSAIQSSRHHPASAKGRRVSLHIVYIHDIHKVQT